MHLFALVHEDTFSSSAMKMLIKSLYADSEANKVVSSVNKTEDKSLLTVKVHLQLKEAPKYTPWVQY